MPAGRAFRLPPSALAGLVAIGLLLSAGAAAAGTTIPAAALRRDAALLREALTVLHPGLDRHLDARGFAREFERLEREFARDRTRAEVFLALTRFTAALRCGHTWPSFYNQSEAVAAELFVDRALPFQFRWLDGRMLVTRSFAAGLAPGAEVVVIDGVPAARLLREMLPLARADGGNDAKRLAQLEVQGRDRLEAFEVLLGLLHPSRAPQWTLEVRAADSRRVRSLTLAVLTRAERAALAAASSPAAPVADNPKGWTLAFEGSTAVMTMPTWAVYDSDWDWRAWIDRAFATMTARDSDGLVIDLRANEGGLEVGDAIVARLIDAPLPRDAAERRVRFRSAPAALRPQLRTWDRSIYALGEGAEELGGGWYRLAPSVSAGAEISPAPPRFRGAVAVLIGPTNSSATFQFAALVKRHALATLVGETTGGSQRGINGGALFFLTLPGSGLEVDLPLIGSFPSGPARPDSGIEPHHQVRPDAADLAAGRDPALEAAIAAARRD